VEVGHLCNLSIFRHVYHCHHPNLRDATKDRMGEENSAVGKAILCDAVSWYALDRQEG